MSAVTAAPLAPGEHVLFRSRVACLVDSIMSSLRRLGAIVASCYRRAS